MKYWAQFYHLRTEPGETKRWVEGVGSDQVLYLDGRWGMLRMDAEAGTVGRKRGFEGYRICRGTSLSDPFYMNTAVRMIL